MKLPLFQVDAFADAVFAGNPAAVVPLDAWLSDEVLQAIAIENNLSETAFFVPREADGWDLRWFTPGGEVDLCGHATLGTAHVLFQELQEERELLRFHTRSGWLEVARDPRGYRMDFPAQPPREPQPTEEAEVARVRSGTGGDPIAVLCSEDWVVVYATQAEVAALQPDQAALATLGRRGVLATAPGDAHDFVSRAFFPTYGIPEDPVTGSAHCELAPYWAERLGKPELRARQISARGGEVGCVVRGDRVELFGEAVTFLRGEIELP